jgi:hypothetical protein
MSIFLILIAGLIEKGKKPHNKIITEIGLRFALLLQSLTHANKQSAQSLKGSGVVSFFPAQAHRYFLSKNTKAKRSDGEFAPGSCRRSLLNATDAALFSDA